MPLFQDVTGQYLGWLKYTMTRTSINPSPQYQRFPLVGGFAPFRQQWWQLNGSSTGKCLADSPKDANHRCGMRRHARLKACAKEVDQQDCCMTQQIPQKRVVKVSKWLLHVFFRPKRRLSALVHRPLPWHPWRCDVYLDRCHWTWDHSHWRGEGFLGVPTSWMVYQCLFHWKQCLNFTNIWGIPMT